MKIAVDRLSTRIQFGAILLLAAVLPLLVYLMGEYQHRALLAGGLAILLLGGAVILAVRHLQARMEEREGECQRLKAELAQRVLERTAALRLASTAVQNTSEAVMVVSHGGLILSVNPAFTEITGYAATEALGRTPHFLRSPGHDEDFYQAIRETLLATRRWQGEILGRRKDGETYHAWLTIDLIPEAEGVPASYVAVFADVTPLRQSEERIRHLAFHDALTGLPNRSLLFDRLQRGIEKAKRENRRLAVMFLDLDRFKDINDTLGHQIGDLLLQEIAKRLCNCLRSVDTVARMGGDEFVVLLEGLEEPGHAAGVAANLIAVVSLPQEVAGYTLQVGVSIGISLCPEDSDRAVELMKYADTAMYAAKLEGQGAFRFFLAAMTEQATRRLQLENDLRRGLREGELELYYQPQVHLDNGRPWGVEALVRWHHPQRGLVMPGEFIPLAEETGLIVGIGDWVLAEACRQTAAWQAGGVDVGVTVNVSARQLQQEELPDRILELIRAHGIQPARLQLELTESVLMADPEKHGEALRRLRAIGVTVAVDDFGTGYSSLSYLRRLPIDVLKIDRSFVADAIDDNEDAQVVRTIIALGQSLGLDLVAEGVETEAQADLLRTAGCPVAQGFLFARPAPADVTEVWLATRALSLG